MKIDITKPVRCRNGWKAEVFAERDGELWGRIKDNKGEWHPRSWNLNGRFCSCDSPYYIDLIQVEEPKEPKRVPLCARDIPPGSAVKHKRWADSCYEMVLSTNDFIIGTHYRNLKCEELQSEGWLIKRPGEDWKPCWKEEV